MDILLAYTGTRSYLKTLQEIYTNDKENKMVTPTYFTNKLKIEVLLNHTVRLTNKKENGKVYLLDAKRFYLLLKSGGRKWKIPTKDGDYVELSLILEYHSAGKHLVSAGGLIATYIAQHDYEMLLSDLETLIKKDITTGGKET